MDLSFMKRKQSLMKIQSIVSVILLVE